MQLPYASQDLDLRFFAVLSSAALALLGMLAAVTLRLAVAATPDFDVKVWWLYTFTSTLGTTTIALLWCYYMLVLGLVFGYRRTDAGDFVAATSFIIVASYYTTVFLSTISPWTRICMQSVM